MEKAVYEFIEVSRVSPDAQKAQTESNEKLYREDALKKQIAILPVSYTHLGSVYALPGGHHECKRA